MAEGGQFLFPLDCSIFFSFQNLKITVPISPSAPCPSERKASVSEKEKHDEDQPTEEPTPEENTNESELKDKEVTGKQKKNTVMFILFALSITPRKTKKNLFFKTAEQPSY